MKILSAAEMREVDRLTTERCGVPRLLLMENAAAAGSSFRFKEIETTEQFWAEATAYPHALFFDAIFGTGLKRPASGLFEEAIRLLNGHSGESPVISVDIPSGIASDTQELIGPAVRAELTVTFTAPKVGNVLPPACDYCGELIVAPIGSPEELINSSGSQLNLIEQQDVERWLSSSRRNPHAN